MFKISSYFRSVQGIWHSSIGAQPLMPLKKITFFAAREREREREQGNISMKPDREGRHCQIVNGFKSRVPPK